MRRRQIMDAAREVFSAKGFGTATMEEIAQRADYKPATLYLYFKNKYELYASLLTEMMQHLGGEFGRWATQPGLDPMAKLDQLPELLGSFYDYDPLVLVALFRLQASQGLRLLEEETLEEINGHAAQAMGHIAAVFKQAMDQGSLEPQHPNAMADSVWAIFTGMVLWEESKRYFDPRKQYLKSTLATAVRLLVRGAARAQAPGA